MVRIGVGSVEDLAKLVEERGGVLSIGMEELRTICGFERLRPGVLSRMMDKLEGNGLAHYPADLPDNRFEAVRLYRRDTPAGRLIEAVLKPSKEADERIIEASEPTDSDALVDRMRDLLLGATPKAKRTTK